MNEKLSALMDSELASAEADALVQALKSDPALQQNWHVYHLVGDSLRKLPQLSSTFDALLTQRLASEPTVLAPRLSKSPSLLKAKFWPTQLAVPLAASVAAFGLLGLLSWQVLQVNRDPQIPAIALTSPPAVTSNSAPVSTPVQTAKGPARVMFSSAASNSYLLAHQEFSPSYAVEGFPAYARTLSEAQDAQ